MRENPVVRRTVAVRVRVAVANALRESGQPINAMLDKREKKRVGNSNYVYYRVEVTCCRRHKSQSGSTAVTKPVPERTARGRLRTSMGSAGHVVKSTPRSRRGEVCCPFKFKLTQDVTGGFCLRAGVSVKSHNHLVVYAPGQKAAPLTLNEKNIITGYLANRRVTPSLMELLALIPGKQGIIVSELRELRQQHIEEQQARKKTKVATAEQAASTVLYNMSRERAFRLNLPRCQYEELVGHDGMAPDADDRDVDEADGDDDDDDGGVQDADEPAAGVPETKEQRAAREAELQVRREDLQIIERVIANRLGDPCDEDAVDAVEDADAVAADVGASSSVFFVDTVMPSQQQAAQRRREKSAAAAAAAAGVADPQQPDAGVAASDVPSQAVDAELTQAERITLRNHTRALVDTLGRLALCVHHAMRDESEVPGVEYRIHMSDGNGVSGIAITHEEGLKTYALHPDVMMLDSTFATSLLNWNLFIALGVDEHCRPVPIGAFLCKLRTAEYVAWGLSALLDMFNAFLDR